MKGNRRYLTAVALLIGLAVSFGVLGTVAPPLAEEATQVQPQQESPSESVGHFQNPPTYDSGWINITDKCGQYFTITHNLNSTDVTVDMQGKTTFDEGVHQRNIGCTSYAPGWNKFYESAQCQALIKTSDGGYALAGGSSLIKTDLNGEVQWTRTYDGIDGVSSVIQTHDMGYALAGAGDGNFWLLKTDWEGIPLWNKTYDLFSDEVYMCSMVEANDDGYALAGYTGSYWGHDSYEYWLAKTDVNGNAEWNKTYGRSDFEGPCSDVASSMVKANDGGYVLAGYSQFQLDAPTSSDCWLVKTDANGNAEWNKTYDTGGGDWAYSVIQTTDGGYAVAGYLDFTTAGGGHFGLIKADAEGTMQWTRLRPEHTTSASCVVQANDGGYALLGSGWGPGSWLVKTEVESGLAWSDSTADTIILYRGSTDSYWNFVHVRIWLIEEPAWIYGDINMDGVVDSKDLYIVGRNYGKTFSLLSLAGIITVAGIHTFKKRKQLS